MTNIVTRTVQIAEALENLGATHHGPFYTSDIASFPEVLRDSATVTTESIGTALYEIRDRGVSLEQAARFFAIVYTDDDVDIFMGAYDDAAPSGYSQEDDLETPAPWCCPWMTRCMTADKGDTPESLGRKAASEDYEELGKILAEETSESTED